MSSVTLTNAWADIAFPLRVSINHRYLIDGKDRPFPIHGDATWSLFTGLTREEAVQYLSARKRQGFNAVLVNILDDSYGQMRDGTRPFREVQGFRQPEEAYFRHIEDILSVALREELLVMLVPVYLGCCEGGWKNSVAASSIEDMRELGRYLGKRFRKFPNVWWVLGGDRHPDAGFDAAPGGVRRHVDALAMGIKETWPESVLTAHTGHNTSAQQQYPYARWLDINNILTFYPEENGDRHIYEWAYRAYQLEPPMPFFLFEAAYESDGRKGQTRLTIRRQMYWAFLGGACGHFYGHGLTWGAKAGWRRGLDAPGVGDVARAKQFFDAIPWYRLQPDLDGRLVIGGQPYFGSDQWMTAASTDDGSLALVYVPRAMEPLSMRERVGALLRGQYAAAWAGYLSQRVVVDHTRFNGVVNAAWFVPSTGLVESAVADNQQGNRGTYTAPCHGESTECDAVLVLKAEKR